MKTRLYVYIMQAKYMIIKIKCSFISLILSLCKRQYNKYHFKDLLFTVFACTIVRPYRIDALLEVGLKYTPMLQKENAALFSGLLLIKKKLRTVKTILKLQSEIGRVNLSWPRSVASIMLSPNSHNQVRPAILNYD